MGLWACKPIYLLTHFLNVHHEGLGLWDHGIGIADGWCQEVRTITAIRWSSPAIAPRQTYLMDGLPQYLERFEPQDRRRDGRLFQ